MTDTRRAQLGMAHDSAAPRAARRFLTGVLAGWGASEEAIERAELLVSELVSNAVLHGGAGEVTLLATEIDAVNGAYRVEVRNNGGVEPVMRRAERDHLSGRGLQLVDHLAVAWGSNTTENQTAVWFELTSSPPG